MSYRSLSPITGYTGHIPGEKWVVGTNSRRSRSWHRNMKKGNGIEGEEEEGRRIEKEGRKGRRRRKNMEAEEEMMMEDEEMLVDEIEKGMKLEDEFGKEEEEEKGEEGLEEERRMMMASRHSNEEIPKLEQNKTKRIIRQISATTSVASLPPKSTSSSGGRSKKSSSRKSVKTNSQSLGQEEGEANSTRTMSPTNEKKGEMEAEMNGICEGRHRRAMDAFANIQPGWWSEGQALKNLRAHKKAIEGGKWSRRQRKSEPIILPYENEPEGELAGSGRREAESAPLETPTKCSIGKGMTSAGEEDIPTPGYSGHLTELYQTSVGKSFGMAAKESKLRQKRYQDELSSNGRGRTFISSSGGSSSPAGKAKSKERLEEEEEEDNYDDQKISPY